MNGPLDQKYSFKFLLVVDQEKMEDNKGAAEYVQCNATGPLSVEYEFENPFINKKY